jgi:hypothetical protein
MQTYPQKQRCFLKAALVCLGLSAMALPAAAAAVYTYAGNPYTVFNGLSCPSVCGITATLDLASPLPPNLGSQILLAAVAPLSFSVTDGANTITQANDLTSSFAVATNSSAQIEFWDFSASYMSGGIPIDISSNNRGSGSSTTHDETFAVISYAENTQDPGTWTLETSSSVPEPADISSILIGLALLTAVSRASGSLRRKSN